MSAVLNYLIKKKITYENIRKYCSNKSLNKNYPELNFIEMEKYYYLILYGERSFEIIFKKKLNLILVTIDNSSIENCFDCYQEIIDLIKKLNIDINDIFINNDKNLNLKENISDLDKYIENNTLNLNEIVLEVPNISKGEIFFRDSSYLPLTLSEYFYDYFPYEKKEDNNISYLESEQRKEIFRNIINLFINDDLRNYKLTGPTSNGKSFTLFFLSRCFNNMIYINLKTIKNKDKKENLKIIISELSRLSLKEDSINKLNTNFKKKVNTKENIFIILLNILDNIPYNEIGCLILILDQYKNENFDKCPDFMKDIDKLMEKYNNLKIITCSSINDNTIRDEVLESLQNNNGNPKYEKKTQNCLFYYGNLYELEASNQNSINYLFENKQKYLFLFRTKEKEKSKKTIFQEISDKITKKLEVFRVSRINSQEKVKNYNYSFDEILIYIKSLFDEEFEIQYLIEVLRMCPLKYIKIIFIGNSFIVKPIFPFIKYYINHVINLNECENYFKKKLYEKYSFQSHRIKAEYFEYSVQTGLKNNNFFQLPNKECREITLYEISKMNKITDFNFDLLGEYEVEDIDANKNNSELYDIKVNEINDSLNSNKIKENSDQFLAMDNNEIIYDIPMSDEIKEENNESTFIDLNNLNIKSKSEIDKKDNSEFIKKLLNKFNINTVIDDKRKELFNHMSKIMKIHERSIDDYRNDVIDKYINYDNNKKEIDSLVKESEINSKKFKGDENFYLTQSKENGECIDFAILFGEKDDKTFVSFQMKCYGSNTKVEEKTKNKIYIKEKLKNILVNSMALFNCQIKHWYYYLVFYLNKNDIENNNISFKEIEKTNNTNIAFLFYNPEEKKFFKNSKEEEKRLNLDKFANLDYDNYISSNNDFILKKDIFEQKKMNPDEGEKKFIEDLSFLFKKTPTFDDIVKLIKSITKIKNNIYFSGCMVDGNIFNFGRPNYETILIYMTKKADNCFALVNESKEAFSEELHIDYYNLKKKNKCKDLPLSSLNMDYYYALSIESDDDDDKPKKEKIKIKSKRSRPKIHKKKAK